MSDPKQPQQEIIDDHLYQDDDYQEDDYDPLDDCALGPDGQCGHAGSEQCDFECPMRDSVYFAGSKLWRIAHGEKT